jgi:hypothetical protein
MEENYRRIENTNWQCFESFLTRLQELCIRHFGLQMHLELPFSWFKQIFEGEYRVVPASVQHPCPAWHPWEH